MKTVEEMSAWLHRKLEQCKLQELPEEKWDQVIGIIEMKISYHYPHGSRAIFAHVLAGVYNLASEKEEREKLEEVARRVKEEKR